MIMIKTIFQQSAVRRLLHLTLTAAVLILALTVFHGTAYASCLPEDIFIQTYDVEDGLKSSEITALEQTNDGYIWAGGYSGLYRFDGMHFSQVLRGSNIFSVMSLYNSTDGHLWIGTNDMGAACYNPETAEIKFYTTEDGLGTNSIRCICEDNEGNMYIGTTSSLCRISKDGKVTSFDSSSINYITSLCCLDSGIVVGTTNSGVPFYVSDDKPKTIAVSSDSDEYFNSIGKMSEKHAYLASSGNKIYDISFEGRKPSVKFYCSTGDISGIAALKSLPNSDCSFVCADNGLGCLENDGTFEKLSLKNFSLMICDVIQDYQGNLWFASTKQGIAKISDNSFQNPLHTASLSNHVVNSITKIGDYMVAGCDDGIISFSAKDNKVSELPWQHEFDGIRIRNILYDSKGNIWISTYGYIGLVRIDSAGSRTVFNDKSNHAVGSRFRYAKELKDGTILAASSTGLNFIDGTKVVATLSKEDGLETEEILDVCETPEGKILAASDGGGIYVIENHKIVDHIGTDDGLETYVVLKIIPCTGGYMYITSNAIYYDDGTEIKRLDNFPYTNCYNARITQDGQAWISSSAGIYVASEQDILENKASYPYILLNQFRGLDATLTSNSWNYTSDDDTLYLCTSKGIRTISIPEFNKIQDKREINAYVQSIVADGTVILPDKQGVYKVPWNTKRITVHPAVLNYNLSLPNIHVWLENFDDQGVTYSQMEQSEISFTNVNPGTHKLVIQILNEKDDTVLNQVTALVKKQAAFHETPWFYLSLVCFIVLVTWAISRLYHYDIIRKQYEEIKDAKEEIERANEAKSLFLAKMSHDIRTPINAIMGMNSMIMQESDSDIIRSYAEDIDISGKTLVGLVDEILDITKIETQKPELIEEEYSTAEMLHEIFSILNVDGLPKGLKILGDFDEKMPARLVGDSLRIKEVLLNLISNAVKYTDKGSITFSAALVEDGSETVKIRFSIKDTGIGIPKDKQDKIFDAFARVGESVNIKGSGLGLNISKQILDLMGSEFELESEVNKGSEFSFVVEQKRASDDVIGSILASKPVSSESENKYEMKYHNPNAVILVVDDMPLNLKVTRYLLKNTGVKIDTAASGSECIKMVMANHYDLILLDDMMDDLSGTETLAWMKLHPNMCKDTPVVVLTANALIGAKEDYLGKGFDAYLSKPVTMADLEEIMIKFVGE